MTDGERLVWSATFALTFDREHDAIKAARAAACAVAALGEAVSPSVYYTPDARDFLDEIVNTP